MPLPNKTLHRLVERFICLMRAPKDENGAVVNDVPVARQSRPDRRAQREENESLCPCQIRRFTVWWSVLLSPSKQIRKKLPKYALFLRQNDDNIIAIYRKRTIIHLCCFSALVGKMIPLLCSINQTACHNNDRAEYITKVHFHVERIFRNRRLYP